MKRQRRWAIPQYLFVVLVVPIVVGLLTEYLLLSPQPAKAAAPSNAELLLIHGYSDNCGAAFDYSNNPNYANPWGYAYDSSVPFASMDAWSYFNSHGWGGHIDKVGYYGNDSQCDHNASSSADNPDVGKCSSLAGADTYTNDPIRDLACKVAWYINDHYTQSTPVYVVAHSMGGLIIRDAIAESGRNAPFPPNLLNVPRVVTLGTPHGGLFGGYATNAVDYGGNTQEVRDMTVGEPGGFMQTITPMQAPQGFNGTYWALLAGSNYDNGATSSISSTIAGNGTNNPYPDGDGVVQADSALSMQANYKILYGKGECVGACVPPPAYGNVVFTADSTTQYSHEADSCGTFLVFTGCLATPFYLNDDSSAQTRAWICSSACNAGTSGKGGMNDMQVVDSSGNATNGTPAPHSLAEILSLLPPYYPPVVDVAGGGAFYAVWQSVGGAGGALGEPTNSWYAITGGQEQDFQGGSIYWSSATGTDEVQSAIYNEYTSVWNGPNGGLGFPTANQQGIAGGDVSYFYGNLCGGRGPNNSGSAIYYSGTTAAHQVGGCIYNKYWNIGGPNSQLNFPTSDVLSISGGYVSYFYGVRCGGNATGPNNSGSAIYNNGGGTYYVQGCVYAKYQQLGATTSALGYPVSDENQLHNSGGSLVGWASYFAGVHCGGNYNGPNGSGSAIYVPASNNSASGGHEVQGCVYAAYQRLGGPTSFLGFPVSDEYKLYNSSGTLIGWATYFAGQYCGSGGPYGSGSAIYVPTSNNSTSGGHEVQGCIYNEYQHMGGPTGMGFPTTDEQNVTNLSGGVIGRENLFNGMGCGSSGGSAILWSSTTGAHEVHGCIYQAYLNFGGAASSLGLPTSDEYTNSSSQRESDFQGGNIVWWNGQAYITVYAGH